MVLAIYKETNMFIEFIEVNPEYRNLNLCIRMLSFLIMQKPEIMSYELQNVGGLSGYSCYVDSFESNNFIVNNKNKNENININININGEICFIK